MTVLSSVVLQFGYRFLWADLQIKRLPELYTRQRIEQNLGTLHQTVAGIYEEILQNIKDKSEESELALKALAWVFHA